MHTHILLKEDATTIEPERSFLRAHITLFSVIPMVFIYYMCFYHNVIDSTEIREMPALKELNQVILFLLFLGVGHFILGMFYGTILIVLWSFSVLFPKYDYSESLQDFLCKTAVYKKTTAS